jgi:hypothetical protein
MTRSSAIRVFAGVAVLSAVGCAHHAAPKPVVAAQPKPPSPPERRVKLAVLPVDSYSYPELAEWLSTLLSDARVGGVDDYIHSKVSLETVQLAIECVDLTSECYAAVGKSLQANRLLLAQIGAGAKKRDRAVHVTITVFDVDAGAPMSAVDRTFKNEEEALADVEELVQQAVKGDP